MATGLQVHACLRVALPQALLISFFLLASTTSNMLLLSSAEPPPSYRFDLIHVDANGGFSKEELIQSAVNRTFLRAADDSTAVEAVYNDMEYLLELQIGTPPKPFLAVADTGSDVTWTRKMALCDPDTSSSFAHMKCSPQQTGDNWATCNNDCWANQGMFTKTYGGGDNNPANGVAVAGFMSTEMLTLSSDWKAGISLGCAFDWSQGLMPSISNGIAGLSRGPKSLFSQLKKSKLSYCLTSRRHPNRRSQLWFGDDDLRLTGEAVQSTPLVTFEEIQPEIDSTSVLANRYYVELSSISIGEKRKDLRAEGFKRRKKDGEGLMFIDSGCSFSTLETAAFNVLVELLEMNCLKKTTPSENQPFTCFERETNNKPGMVCEPFPGMVLHLTDAEMDIPWDSYMFEQEQGTSFCLDILKSEKSTILGNNLQQNVRMLFDVSNNKLSFERVQDCSTL